jgi:hypothetical protein
VFVCRLTFEEEVVVVVEIDFLMFGSRPGFLFIICMFETPYISFRPRYAQLAVLNTIIQAVRMSGVLVHKLVVDWKSLFETMLTTLLIFISRFAELEAAHRCSNSSYSRMIHVNAVSTCLSG